MNAAETETSITQSARIQGGRKFDRNDLEFYPPLIEITERPPHPVPRAVAMIIAFFLLCAIVWSLIGTTNITATATGRVVVTEGNTYIQPFETATVKKVLVKNGEKVKAGQILVQFDDTTAKAERDRLINGLQSAAVELGQARTLLARMNGDRAASCQNFSPSKQSDAQCDFLTNSEWADLEGKRARFAADVMQRKAELYTLAKQITKIEQILPIISKREVDFEKLTAQGFVSKYSVQDRVKDRIETERELETLRSRQLESDAAIAGATVAQSSWISETKHSLTERGAQAEIKLDELGLQLKKAELTLSHQTIRARASGHVQEISLKGEGEVATAAQNLMVLVPDKRSLTIDVAVNSSDIGFVRIGQLAVIKMDTFPYTKYGYVYGKITMLSPDIIIDEKKGAYFSAEITPIEPMIVIDRKRIPLSAGMTLTAEIETGQRRIIEYVLDPISQRMASSLHER